MRLRSRQVLALVVAVVAAVGAVTAATSGRGPTRPRNPLRGARLFVDPRAPAAAQVRAYDRAGDAGDAALMRRIAREATATWLAGTSAQARRHVADVVHRAAAEDAVPVVVLYAIPHRDCGGASSGGAASAADYRAWVDGVASAIGAHRAVAIVEPDATAHVADHCLDRGAAAEREALLAYAVRTLKQRTRATVYLDAGNPGWVAPGPMAAVLRRAGVARADGFAVDVGNFYTTTESRLFGHRLSHRLGGAHFVIDTSRNGNGPYRGSLKPRWCNPPGRALGRPPTTATGDPAVDALLWIKYPGQSDGSCRGGDPPAGAWWPEYALGLARGG